MEANKTAQDMNVKVPLISKIAYGFGDVGCNFSWMFVGNFLMIFYTDVCAIPMTAVSLLMLISRFWDAINDPLIGSLSRGLGALLELLIYIMVLYFIYVWFLLWLVGLLPDLAVVNTIFTSSQVVLGIILDIGSLIWYSALTVI